MRRINASHIAPALMAVILISSWVIGSEPDQNKPNSSPAISPTNTLTLAGAQQVADAALAEAHRLDAPGGTIAIVDPGGHLIYLVRPDGTVPATPPVATGKARTAAIFQKPTAVFETIINDGRTAMTAIEGFMPMQGGIPIVVDGRVVGAIGVSGAASAKQDEEIAIAGAAIASTFTQ